MAEDPKAVGPYVDSSEEIISAVRKMAERSKRLRERAAELRDKARELKQKLPRKQSR
ncbi:MAG TPA: hypothetical protein VE964_13565 [Myxococcales bacterium]|nr:hypothetical protein [Myxococcales bacterium]